MSIQMASDRSRHIRLNTTAQMGPVTMKSIVAMTLAIQALAWSIQSHEVLAENCMMNPFASGCRGISAKRSELPPAPIDVDLMARQWIEAPAVVTADGLQRQMEEMPNESQLARLLNARGYFPSPGTKRPRWQLAQRHSWSAGNE